MNNQISDIIYHKVNDPIFKKIYDLIKHKRDDGKLIHNFDDIWNGCFDEHKIGVIISFISYVEILDL